MNKDINARTSLRTIFDQAALDYDDVRPGYPGELIEDVISISAIPKDGRILEIGCGAGQATIPFAKRGYLINSSTHIPVTLSWRKPRDHDCSGALVS